MSDGVPSSGADPDDDVLLRAFVVCGTDRLTVDVLAAATATTDTALRIPLQRLAERGVVTTTPAAGTDTVTLQQRPTFPSAGSESVASRISRHFRALAEDSATKAEHGTVRAGPARPENRSGQEDGARLWSARWPVVGVMRWATQHDSAVIAVGLARAWWPVAGLIADPAWSRELAEVGEQAAIALRDPAALTELLTLGAARAEQAGDRQMEPPAAEQQMWRYYFEEHARGRTPEPHGPGPSCRYPQLLPSHPPQNRETTETSRHPATGETGRLT